MFVVISAHPALASTAVNPPAGIHTKSDGTKVLHLLAQSMSEVQALLDAYFARDSGNQLIVVIVPDHNQPRGRQLHVYRHPAVPGLSDQWILTLRSMHATATQAIAQAKADQT